MGEKKLRNLGANINRHGIGKSGIKDAAVVHWNLAVPELYEKALRNSEGFVVEGGAFAVNTGVHTGRSANDKFFLALPGEDQGIDWGKVNKPIEEANFEAILGRHLAHYRDREIYVQDCWAGAHEAHRLAVRVVTETAWHSLFARNMFLRPSPQEQVDFEPGFTILHAPSLIAPAATPGLVSGTYILVSFKHRLVIIGGTSYAGEIKKSVFAILNYLLPEADILPMRPVKSR